MNVLAEAMDRANARKEAVMPCEGTFDSLLLMLSGCDIDPADLAGYMDVAEAAFTLELAFDKPLDVVLRGVLAEGMLMGMMIERVQRGLIESGAKKAPEPTIGEAATMLWNVLLAHVIGERVP